MDIWRVLGSGEGKLALTASCRECGQGYGLGILGEIFLYLVLHADSVKELEELYFTSTISIVASYHPSCDHTREK